MSERGQNLVLYKVCPLFYLTKSSKIGTDLVFTETGKAGTDLE